MRAHYSRAGENNADKVSRNKQFTWSSVTGAQNKKHVTGTGRGAKLLGGVGKMLFSGRRESEDESSRTAKTRRATDAVLSTGAVVAAAAAATAMLARAREHTTRVRGADGDWLRARRRLLWKERGGDDVGREGGRG